MGKIILCAIMIVSLAACSPPTEVRFVDKAVEREQFNSCLANAPAGPASTKYNDWDELVYACRSTATYIATTCVKNCRFTPTTQEPHDGR